MVGDQYEETDTPRTEQVLCEMKNGNYIIGVICTDCYCYLKYMGICHHCPDRIDYWNFEEYIEHVQFIRDLVNVYSYNQ
jgi:hypothetical protein